MLLTANSQYKTFNARKESIISGQRLWTPVRKHSRCVVPIEGYYEWQHKKVGQSKKVDKIPYFLRRKDKKLMFLAGMFSKVNFEDTNDSFKTFTIITGPAPKQTKWLHERMPVVLTPGTKEWDAWLDNDKEWDDSLATSLAEYAKDDLEWFEVTRDVGKVTNEGEYLIKPLKHGNIGDFFGKSKKQQIKGEAGDIKKEETIDDKANEKKNTLDITKMVSTKNEKSEVKKEEDADTQKENKSDAAKGSKKVKKETDDDHEEDETKEDEEEEEIIQPGSKRPAEDDNNISQRVSREHKKPKVT